MDPSVVKETKESPDYQELWEKPDQLDHQETG